MPQQLRRLTAAVLFAIVSLGLVGPIAAASAQEATATPATTMTTATPEATTAATPAATMAATPAATMAATPAATTGATAAPTATPVKALPKTGTETTTLAVLGILLVGCGLTAVSLSRRAV